MYFYVFLQPEVFEEAVEDGEDAMQNVASILVGFSQNCFLAVFEDDRWGSSVKEKIEHWPGNMTRRRVKSILTHVKKARRFIYCIKPDYQGAKPDLDCVFEQATSASLDVILVVASEENRNKPKGVEVATRRKYQDTAFETLRSSLGDGKTCNPGDMDEASFLTFHFEKALKYAAEIHICDRLCGKLNFADNFRYTISKLMSWLGTVLADPANCKIIFHLGQPSGQGIPFILSELGSLKRGSLSGISLEARFYDESLPNPTLPHQRFIVSDQIALNIDRGMDFLDRKTGRCRDTYINRQSLAEAQRLLQSYASGCVAKLAV